MTTTVKTKAKLNQKGIEFCPHKTFKYRLLSIYTMADSRQRLVESRIGDLTKCSICAEIFTNPKILPCVHTFCLHCLEEYAKEKQPGDQITCPLCRNEFLIPTGGLRDLPNNFFIGELVEIGKLSVTGDSEAKCNICPEGEELIGKMYCIDCEQILCERCSKSHKRTKFSENHQVMELGSNVKSQEFNSRNSYCDQHPKQLITMYCTEHNVAICLICFAESHQSHKCVTVDKVAGEFTKRLKDGIGKVTQRLPECENVGKKLDNYKKDFMDQISKNEETILATGTELKKLIDNHTELLVRELKLLKLQNLKAFESTKQDVERFRVMIESFSRYCEELLSQGSPVDICRAADQMHARANELEKLPANCSGERFCCSTVAFRPSSFENILKKCRSNNVVGTLEVFQDRILGVETDGLHCKTEIIQILIHRVSEKTRLVSLSPNTKLDELYDIVSKQCTNGMKTTGFYLVSGGRILPCDSEKYLLDYNVANQSTVFLNFRPR